MNLRNGVTNAAIAAGLLIAIVGTKTAEAETVNLDGIANAGLTGSDAVYVTLQPGTYTIDPIEGVYTAFDRFGEVSGCNGSGGDCTEGWEFSYRVIVSPTNTVDVGSGGGFGPISGGGYYMTAIAALDYAKSNYVVGPFTLTTPRSLGFYINDDNLSDNIGGISLNIASVTGVPEPATWVLTLLGFGAVGYAMRKPSNARTKVTYLQPAF